ncbi:phosphoribosylglycinamide formyltransferase [Selenomonadales bacterium OttesenSCG-928-I06]|nr:phosphoribosylglycinamide formyltransferase [Selenomonadales bacterium OttesenSCG-928-I06]
MPTKTVLGIILSGRGSNMQAIVDAISAGRLANAKVGVIISDNPNANALTRIPASDIPRVCIERENFKDKASFEKALIKELRIHHVELVVLAGFMRILSAEFLNEFNGNVMNIHPSLLPAFSGLKAQEQTLNYGVKVSGCTVHFVDDGMDTGPVILQQAVPVLENDTVESLSERILHVEHILYPRAISLFCEGRLKVVNRKVQILEKPEK